MSSDRYCALCSGPLTAEIKIGTHHDRKLREKYLARRRKRLAEREKYGDMGMDSDDDNGAFEKYWDFEDCSDRDDNCDTDSSNYDPELVREADVQWLNSTACLGFNPDANSAIDKAWEDWGYYRAHGEFELSGMFDYSTGSRAPSDPRAYCYHTSHSNRIPVFPYHRLCKVILGQVLGRDLLLPISAMCDGYEYVDEDISSDSDDGSHDTESEVEYSGHGLARPRKKSADFKTWWSTIKSHSDRIDNDSLYYAMSQLNRKADSLDVDYGGIEGAGRTWESISGEEFSVHSPRLQKRPVTGLRCNFAREPAVPQLNLYDKVLHDPFENVPEDILYMISDHLPGKSVTALRQASWFYNRATFDNIFWKRRIQQDFLPWYWELRQCFEELPKDTTDYKRLYLWIDHATAPRLGQRDLLPIINRRRIWTACEEIKEVYTNEFIRKMRADAEEEPMAMESRQMPATMYPTPPGISRVWTHWPEGFAVGPGVFESFWNRDGALVGIALSMPSKRKILGQDEDESLGIVKKCAPIPAGESITGLILHISNVDLSTRKAVEAVETISKHQKKTDCNRRREGHGVGCSELCRELNDEYFERHQKLQGPEEKLHPKNLCKASIRALTIKLKSGISFDVGIPTETLNKRPLFIQPATTLLGLQATTAVVFPSDRRNDVFTDVDYGAITRLALIHTPEESDDIDEEEIPLALRTLWHPQATNVPARHVTDDTVVTCPIWEHPNLRMIDYPENPEHMDTKLPLAFLPHQALVWAADSNELAQMKRISVLREVVASEHYRTDEKPDEIRRIIGILVTYQDSSVMPPRSIGHSRLSSKPRTESEPYEEDLSTPEWPESHMSHFDVDGFGGEAILNVWVDPNNARCMMVRTTWNRTCVWRNGEDDGEDESWTCKENVAGGLSAAFDPEEGGLVVATELELIGITAEVHAMHMCSGARGG